jgi:FkbM family methyltransferase
MTNTRHDFGDVLVFLRKMRETPPYPWELLTHRGRMQHNLRWSRKRGEAVQAEAKRRGITIPANWTIDDACGMYPVFCSGIYEVPGFEPAGTVVDVGAGYGDYAVLIGRLPAVREVVALEPTPHPAQRAREFVAANGAKVRIVEAAGGKASGRMQLGAAGTEALSVLSDSGTIDVAVVAIDDLGLDKVDFIKIDVEGAEIDVLEGGRKTLARDHPRIAIEVHSKALAGQVHQLLTGLGYTLAYHDHGVRASWPMDLVQNRFYAAAAPAAPAS